VANTYRRPVYATETTEAYVIGDRRKTIAKATHPGGGKRRQKRIDIYRGNTNVVSNCDVSGVRTVKRHESEPAVIPKRFPGRPYSVCSRPNSPISLLTRRRRFIRSSATRRRCTLQRTVDDRRPIL